LTYEESYDMMKQILNQSVHPEQISAFLLGWRLKPETVDEFRGALSACDELITYSDIPNSIELGYPFDGKRRNPYIFPLVAKELKDSGLDLVVIGDELQPAKHGITTKEVCTSLELPEGVKYFDRADFFKKMIELTQIRMRLGLRTAFNTIEKLPHVAKSNFAITGVFHKPYVKKYVEIFSERYKRFALIQGNEGTPELFSKGRMWIGNDGKTEEFIIDPAHYGINYTKSWENISFEESLDQIKNPTDEYLKLARLNAAIYLFIAQKVKSIDEGYELLNG
ncbi:MAG: glycosyl transferase, partial [Thiovulaceae bacterium]|nr:glycosyl transferase [Sulfurimonadaceae bacterium]